MSENTENILVIDADNATVKAVVNQIKSDMRGGRKYLAYADEFRVTRENVAAHAKALARLVTPETAQRVDGKRTKFGNAVQAAGAGLRTALGKDEAGNEDDTTDYLAKVIAAVENALGHEVTKETVYETVVGLLDHA